MPHYTFEPPAPGAEFNFRDGMGVTPAPLPVPFTAPATAPATSGLSSASPLLAQLAQLQSKHDAHMREARQVLRAGLTARSAAVGDGAGADSLGAGRRGSRSLKKNNWESWALAATVSSNASAVQELAHRLTQ